jgi:hypothetical protein
MKKIQVNKVFIELEKQNFFSQISLCKFFMSLIKERKKDVDNFFNFVS